MLLVHDLKKIFVYPLKTNRLVDDSNGESDYQQVSKLTWSEHKKAAGKIIKIKKFQKDFRVKLFQVVVMKDCMEYVVTNDVTQNSSTGIREVTAYRWRIEQFHRELNTHRLKPVGLRLYGLKVQGYASAKRRVLTPPSQSPLSFQARNGAPGTA